MVLVVVQSLIIVILLMRVNRDSLKFSDISRYQSPAISSLSENPTKSTTRPDKKTVAENLDLPDPRPYVGGSGNLSSKIIEENGLSQKQYEEIQNAVSGFWGMMSEKAAERVNYDITASNASPDEADIYRLPALSETERLQAEVSLKDQITKVAGEALAEEVIRSLKSGTSFGAFGKYDVVFRFKPMIVKVIDKDDKVIRTYVDKSDLMVDFDFINPASGGVVMSGTSTSSELTKDYGHIFVPPGQ
jgi:hypothetical protein